eukprot:TRINITY_DN13747_c0_g1_i1.p1 TRINITY_DN13747_c0_g1~~TRINITY_DN13747_c0_g1_i1.p1  ORF type:complete len:567 (-),score=115.09 TRINITY_DN13747_c0_g1_i1:246-1946(-)
MGGLMCRSPRPLTGAFVVLVFTSASVATAATTATTTAATTVLTTSAATAPPSSNILNSSSISSNASATGSQPEKSTSAEYVRLSFSEDGQLVLAWSTDASSGFSSSSKSKVRYTPAGSDISSGTTLPEVEGPLWKNRRWSAVKLAGLEPSTEYAYQIDVGDGHGFGTKYRLHSPPAPSASLLDAPIQIALVGDLGLDKVGSQSWNVIQKLSQQKLDAAIHLGDIAGGLSEKEVQKGESFLGMVQPLSSKTPFLPLAGDKDNIETFKHFYRKSSPDGNPWYAFSIGPVRIIMLWTEALADLGASTPSFQISEAQKQLQWLEVELKQSNSPERRQQQPWVLVAGHRPIYCSVLRPTCSSEAATLRAVLEPFLTRYNVDLYLSAHVHAYERTFPVRNGSLCFERRRPSPEDDCGPIHIMNGAAGLPPLEYKDLPARWTVQRHPGQFGYGHITVINSSHLLYRQIDSETGAASDEHMLVKDFASNGVSKDEDEVFLEAVGWLAFATALVTVTCGFVKWVHEDGLKRRNEAMRNLRTEIAVLTGLPMKALGNPREAEGLIGGGGDHGEGLH